MKITITPKISSIQYDPNMKNWIPKSIQDQIIFMNVNHMSNCPVTVTNQLQYSLIFWFLSSSSPVVKESQIQQQNMCYFTEKKIVAIWPQKKNDRITLKMTPPTTLLWFWGQNIVGNMRCSTDRFIRSAKVNNAKFSNAYLATFVL